VARRYMLSRNLKNEEAKARYRAVEIRPQWIVTPGKQTTNRYNECRNIFKHFSVFPIVPFRNNMFWWHVSDKLELSKRRKHIRVKKRRMTL
jgi:hypothetical protein